MERQRFRERRVGKFVDLQRGRRTENEASGQLAAATGGGAR